MYQLFNRKQASYSCLPDENSVADLDKGFYLFGEKINEIYEYLFVLKRHFILQLFLNRYRRIIDFFGLSVRIEKYSLERHSAL